MYFCLTVCLSVCLSICLLDTLASTLWLKMSESIQMPFWMRTHWGRGNHILKEGPDLPRGRSNLDGPLRPGVIITLPACFWISWCLVILPYVVTLPG